MAHRQTRRKDREKEKKEREREGKGKVRRRTGTQIAKDVLKLQLSRSSHSVKFNA